MQLFNADEVYAMAIQIESNGAEFYRLAAERAEDPGNAAFLNQLVKMEEAHKRLFAQLREDAVQADTGFDLSDEGGLYLSAIANGIRVEGAPTVAEKLTGLETMEEILQTAVELEKESVLFYLGIKSVVPDDLGKDKIDRIIDEEKKHIVQLSDEVERIRASA